MICVNLHNSYLKVDNVVIWWLATISRLRDLVGFERWVFGGKLREGVGRWRSWNVGRNEMK